VIDLLLGLAMLLLALAGLLWVIVLVVVIVLGPLLTLVEALVPRRAEPDRATIPPPSSRSR
jgi:hypothetical protein